MIKINLYLWIQSVTVNDVNSSKDDAIFRISDEDFEPWKEICNRTHQEWSYCMSAIEFGLSGDTCESDDKMPRLATILQLGYLTL